MYERVSNIHLGVVKVFLDFDIDTGNLFIQELSSKQ